MKSLKELMDLRGRTALVTGGAGHIGSALCDALAELGANIAVVDLEQATCDERARGLTESYGIKAAGFATNLEDEAILTALPARIEQEFGRLDILVHCAALVGSSSLHGWNEPFEKQTADTWRRALEINLTAPFVLTQACASLLAKSPGASVVNISSIYGVVGPDLKLYSDLNMNNPAAYAASKGGLVQLTRWLSTVMAEKKVRVNSISLGGIERGQPDVFQERYRDRTPLGRMGTEEDLKGAIAYLASDMSAYVTGHNLMVEGGWAAW